ncbi:sarcosine oxidase subunit gamma [Specibacter cremeus]|uniref:sarcosine oxidase subunit gamma n=1 Tax=Specibacter cremeus TaxID=1629051 RepID=UPI000F76CF74|nr:sarcosine oxidase subunit gamma family protein [Specibacter cremeus]
MANTAELTNAEVLGLRRSPAGHLADDFAKGSTAGTHGVSLRELPFQSMVGVRVDPGSDAGARVAAVTGGLPASCGQVVAGPAGLATLWLGPQEFLVTAPADRQSGLAPDLVAALADGAGQVVELSANRTTFELSGPSARAVLEKGCAADLHPRAFTVGTAITTEIGGIPVVLWKTGDDTFWILPRASFADFLGRWLLDGMREFASVEGTPWP